MRVTSQASVEVDVAHQAERIMRAAHRPAHVSSSEGPKPHANLSGTGNTRLSLAPTLKEGEEQVGEDEEEGGRIVAAKFRHYSLLQASP